MEEVEGLSSPRCPRTVLLCVACVCVTEYDRATSNYLEPLREEGSMSNRATVEPADRSAVSAEHDERPCPSCSATDSGPAEGKLGIGVSWRRVMVVRSRSVELGGPALHDSVMQTSCVGTAVNTSHGGSDLH